MSAEQMRLPVDAVVQHANSVSAAAEAVRQARGAVEQVAMDSQSYGQLCQFLPTVLGVVFEAAVVVMNSSAEALQETAINLRAAVDTFEGVDEAGAQSIRSHL